MTEGLRELVGQQCTADFDRERVPHELTAGFPAWIVVDAVDMPLVKVRSIHAGRPLWVNAAAIRWIHPLTSRLIPDQPSPVV